jgi:mRNA-degrading endonuclease toxin of MazEF toxin-antitoxin module
MVKLTPDGLNMLHKESTADCFQIRALDQTRFVAKIGEVSSADMNQISQALKVVLSL